MYRLAIFFFTFQQMNTTGHEIDPQRECTAWWGVVVVVVVVVVAVAAVAAAVAAAAAAAGVIVHYF